MESNSFLIDSVNANVPHSLARIDQTSDVLTLTFFKSGLLDAIHYLKTMQGFSFLTDLCGVHYPDSDLPLGVVYHLHNLQKNQRIRIKTFTSVQDPEIPSLTALFPSSNWMERETYDFYGIQFTGHPNLTRILNEDTMTYFPLRKEYPLEDATRTDKDDTLFGR